MTDSSGGTSIAVAGAAATIYTHSKSISFGQYFGIALQMTSSAGGVKQTVVMEQSWAPPTTEGALDLNWVTPNGILAIVTDRTAETVYTASLSPVAAPYIRFKITSAAGNHADSLTWIRLITQEEI